MIPVNEIAAQLTALRDGQVSLAEVAAAFRQRRWHSSRGDGGDRYGRGGGHRYDGDHPGPPSEPGASVPGSMDEITAAYDRGELTREQYRVLARAVADAINAAGPQTGR